MSDIIRLLPDSVANQIAAGEVIQRPASVVKELVENAIDADASEIHLLVTDAGRTCVQVIDNGKGMSETDARLSFERHATSKIQTAKDLFALHTMGFRGEALASIAAVAQVELKTRMRQDEVGTLITIAGSAVESQKPIACPVGCNFSINNLFFNVPARRKFLKSNQTELSNIMTEFERILLVHPDILFTLHSNDVELFNLPSCGLRQRIIQVFGKKINQQIIPVEVSTTLIEISGFVSKPEAARKKGAHQYFFVNGRYMRHPYFHRAVMEAYEKILPPGEQVSYFIYFKVDPANIDVNIHPTKTEIKFENETPIWQILLAAIKESLGKFNEVPSIDFDTEGMLGSSAEQPSQTVMIQPPTVSFDPTYNPFAIPSPKASPQLYPDINRTSKKVEWEALYGGLEKAQSKAPSTPLDQFAPTLEQMRNEDKLESMDSYLTDSSEHLELGSMMGQKPLTENAKNYHQFQFKGKYILTSVKSGLMLIDQRRAHIRVLYDRYRTQMNESKSVTQKVLFPEVVDLSPAESAFLGNVVNDMTAVGFDLSDLGGGSYSISGVPSGIEGLSPAQLVQEMVCTAMHSGTGVEEKIRDSLALTMAKASALVYGQVLNSEETANLMNSLFACAIPNYTPDGKVILSVIKENDIEKLFH